MTAALALQPQAPLQGRAERYRDAGIRFLSGMFGPRWRSRLSHLHDLLVQTPIDEAWVAKRYAALEPMGDAPWRQVPRDVWHLSRGLGQHGRAWQDFWCAAAARTPLDWLVQFCGVAVLKADGSLRSLDNPRVRPMLAAGVLLWQLAEYDPEGDPVYPFVVRGLPYGAWCHLLSYSEAHHDGMRLRVPSEGAVFGSHRVGGDPTRGQCGYIASFKHAGIARSTQPCGFTVDPALRGKMHFNDRGDLECWAFHELRLCVPVAMDEVRAMGGTRAWWSARPRKPPPSEGIEEPSAAWIDECERDWFPGEAFSEPAPPPLRILPLSTVVSARSTLDAEDEQFEHPCEDDGARGCSLEGPADHEPDIPLTIPPPLAAESAAVPVADADQGEQSNGEGEAAASRRTELEDGRHRRVREAMPVWLAEPGDQSRGAKNADSSAQDSLPEPQRMTIAVDDPGELELPATTGAPLTVYGAGRLTVVRAAATQPASPRLQRALERFTEVARQRDRGPPAPE